MKTFRMTCDRFHFLTPLVLTPLLLAQAFFVPLMLGRAHQPPPIAQWLSLAFFPALFLGLGVTALMTPRAVRLTPEELVIERFFWPPFTIPLSTLSRVDRGPTAGLLRGGVRRLAGVGGWFWSGGLFRVREVGNVRAWLTRLGPTLLLHRTNGLPVLLTVDDTEGLYAALRLLKPV